MYYDDPPPALVVDNYKPYYAPINVKPHSPHSGIGGDL